MRTEGYYFVNPEGRGWIIAKWNGRYWERGWYKSERDKCSEWLTDEFCLKIDERPIVREIPVESVPKIDYQELLRRYIIHVEKSEGSDCTVGLNSEYGTGVIFTELEVKALNELSVK